MQHQFFTKQKSFVCEVCNRNFKTKVSYDKHIKDHPKEKIICEICNKSLRSKYYLKEHMKIHSGKESIEKQYVCKICSRKFSYLGHLKVHERVHTGEKPYVCEICQRGFTILSSLKRHYLLHTDEKPFVCEICNKGFIVKSELDRHYKMHAQENVSKFSLDGNHLADEINVDLSLVHVEKKVYTCEQCDNKFKRNVDLHRHKYFHHGKQKVVIRNETETLHSPSNSDEIMNYSQLMQKNSNTYERHKKNIESN